MFPMHATLVCVLASPIVQPEVKWAKGIMDDFWAALLTDAMPSDWQPYIGLLTPEFAKSFQTPRGLLSDLDVLGGNYCDSHVTVSSAMLSPDRNEVVFKGLLAGKEKGDPKGKKVEADFTVRVAKQPGGAWSIRFLRVVERTEKVGLGRAPDQSDKP
jgi:hypothetical protein